MRAEREAVKTKGGKRFSAVQWNGRGRERAQKDLKEVECQGETRKGSGGQVGAWSPMFPERGTVVLLVPSLLPLGPNS